MRFKQGVKIRTSEFWYDLTDGGYIRPEGLLECQKDIDMVNKAIETLLLFKNEAEKNGVLEEF